MKYCNHCGQELVDDAVVCTNCGRQVGEFGDNVKTTGSFGWAILGFFFPLIGLILYLVWKKTRPMDAKYSGYGALIGFIANIVCLILFDGLTGNNNVQFYLNLIR